MIPTSISSRRLRHMASSLHKCDPPTHPNPGLVLPLLMWIPDLGLVPPLPLMRIPDALVLMVVLLVAMGPLVLFGLVLLSL